MKNKFSPDIQIELNEIKYEIQVWKSLFDIEIELYIDGWAIFLREKNIYPRSIIIFKSYENSTYTIKSFEIHLKNYEKEEFRELYSIEGIKNKNNLLNELKSIIYGKDLMSKASNLYRDNF
ncbi:hypothetical protein LCGC14_1456990 [marine sediment metagenome]|uniref:Uncharacterized protein n=1 Tax=marine sediment metagenome TaxID=412755 RepID=A0A0F9MI65_9ZZZZ